MAVTKSGAYINECGPEKITAWAIRQRRRNYGGVPLGKTYWSNDKAGQRKPVKQVQKGGATFFSYLNGADAAGGGGGESLTHRLFKEAIAGLSGTQLRLHNFGEHAIEITYREMEKQIDTEDGPYFADVYLQFTSTTSLGLKWSGEMYVEVKSTHAVPPHKQDGLRRARLPVVEVVVPGTLEYEIADEDTTDLDEAAHIRRVQNVLQKGFLAGRVISDRSSAEYLEQEVERLGHALRQSRQDTVEAERRGNAALQRLTQAAEQETGLQSTVNDLTVQVRQAVALANDHRSKLDAESENVRRVSQSLCDANETIAVQKKELRLDSRQIECIQVLHVHEEVLREHELLDGKVVAQQRYPTRSARLELGLL